MMWDMAAAPLVMLTNIIDYIRIGLTWPGYRTKFTAAKTNQSTRLLYRVFAICLTEAYRNWRHIDTTNINHEMLRILGNTDSTFTLSANHTSLSLYMTKKLHTYIKGYQLNGQNNMDLILTSFYYQNTPTKCESNYKLKNCS